MLTSYFPLWRKVRSGLVCNYTRELPILWLCVCLKTKFHPLTPNRKCPDCLSCQTKGPSRAAAAAQRTATIVLPHRFVLEVAVIVDPTGLFLFLHSQTKWSEIVLPQIWDNMHCQKFDWSWAMVDVTNITLHFTIQLWTFPHAQYCSTWLGSNPGWTAAGTNGALMLCGLFLCRRGFVRMASLSNLTRRLRSSVEGGHQLQQPERLLVSYRFGRRFKGHSVFTGVVNLCI